MPKFQLVSDLKPSGDQPEAIKSLLKGIELGYSHQTLLGVTGSGKTFSVANIISDSDRPALILAPNKTLAAQLYGEFKPLFPRNSVEYFVSYYDYYQPEAYVPSSDTFIQKDASINENIEQMRLSATKALLERRDTIIIATVSCIYGLGSPERCLQMVLHIVLGEKIDQRQIIHSLIDLQYTRNNTVLTRATFRVRGEVIEVYPAESNHEAIRIALFDDEIEDIISFNPSTGRKIKKITKFTFYPKSHYVTPRSVLLEARENIKLDLKKRLDYFRSENKLLEAQRLEERTSFDLEMMLEIGYCNGIENYSRYLSGRTLGDPPPTLFDYMPADSLLIIDESHISIPQLRAMYKGDRSRKENLVAYGFRLPSALDNRPMSFQEWENCSPQTIFVSATPGEYENEYSSQIVEQIVRPTGLVDPKIEVRPGITQVDDLLSEINKRIFLKERVLVTTLTKKMSEHLSDYLSDHGVRVRYLHSDINTIERIEIIRDLRLGIFDVLVGINLLREGLDIPEVSLVAILDADKEGFLRSEISLIQTIGRAARNINGCAILYADSITKSMEKAIKSTNKRRERQAEFNRINGITPKGIKKRILDIMEENTSLIVSKESRKEPVLPLIKKDFKSPQRSIEEIDKDIYYKEKKMHDFSQKMEFEKAAKLRDEIIKLQKMHHK